MAVDLPGPRLLGRVAVRVSPVIDLNFASFAARKPGKEDSTPWLRDLVVADPALRQRLATFWPDAAEFCYDEMVVIAHTRGDLFAGDPAAFLEDLRAGVPPISVPPLPSEDADAPVRIEGRIERLRADATLRNAYVDMFAALWRHLLPLWNSRARGEATAVALELERRIASAGNIGDILPGSHIAMLERHRGYVNEAIERAEAVLVPLTLNPTGTYLFSLPGLLVISYGPEAGRRAAARREQSAKAAVRFKVLSDPTRLAFVNRLLHGPVSVTDLAVSFELAQPTVSAHVKILRDAGLLEAERSGTYTLYRVDEERLRRFIDEAVADLTRQH